MIRLTVIGNVGKDATIKEVNGKQVINFQIAHSRKYKDKTGAMKEVITWIDCHYWHQSPKIAPALKKGTKIYCEGLPETQGYQAKDGTIKGAQHLRVSNLSFIANTQASNDISQSDAQDMEDDLPF